MKRSVLLLVQNLPVPQDRRFWMEAEALKHNGFKVTVISPRKPGQKKSEKLAGIQIYRYLRPPQSNGWLGYIFEYSYSLFWSFYLSLKVAVTQGFSIIQAANPPDLFFLIASFYKLFGVSFVFDQHDLVPEMFLCKFSKSRKHPVYKLLCFLEGLSLKICDVHLATCVSGQQFVQKRQKIECPSVVVRSAPDLAKLNTNKVNPEIEKKVEKLKRKFKYLGVYLGVMGPQDGVDKLLRSIRFIVHDLKRKDIGFVLMGEGDDLERLKIMAQKFRIERQVVFTGWADQQAITAYFSQADLGLMPEPKNDYTDNSLHNKILEYMAFGLPILAYDLKELRLNTKRAAVYVKDDDEKRYAKIAVKLLDSPQLRKEMGNFGKQRMELENFKWEASVEELLKAYEYLMVEKAEVHKVESL
ncbi:MAG: glycosyltransferase family 4 protein [Patescibacteria group bacterium]|nr:glycosyltransferase family 4 protein [Patescibacteria group bacterium]